MSGQAEGIGAAVFILVRDINGVSKTKNGKTAGFKSDGFTEHIQIVDDFHLITCYRFRFLILPYSLGYAVRSIGVFMKVNNLQFFGVQFIGSADGYLDF